MHKPRPPIRKRIVIWSVGKDTIPELYHYLAHFPFFSFESDTNALTLSRGFVLTRARGRTDTDTTMALPGIPESGNTSRSTANCKGIMSSEQWKVQRGLLIRQTCPYLRAFQFHD